MTSEGSYKPGGMDERPHLVLASVSGNSSAVPIGQSIRAARRAAQRRAQAEAERRRAENPNITPLDERRNVLAAAEEAVRRFKGEARRRILISLALMVGIPTALGAIYFGLIAADQYAAEARFTVRGSTSEIPNIIGYITGGSGGSNNVADAYILRDYIASRELVERIQTRLPLREMYARPEADFWARFSPTRPVEEFVVYWNKMVMVEFDQYSGIISLKVKAFRADDAKEIASQVVEASEMLVNRLSEKARADAVNLAEKELQLSEWRLRDARNALTEFQNKGGLVNPVSNAKTNESIISELQGKVAEAESELTRLSALMSADSPSVRGVKSRIAALQAQIVAERQKVAGPTPGSGPDAAKLNWSSGISSQLASFEELKTTAEFAEKAYVTSLGAVEVARTDVKRNQRYLALFVNPLVPQYAVYPLRWIGVGVIFICSLMVWAVLGLFHAAIRDHVA